MKRLIIGTVLGGFAAYLYDPELGVERRARLLSLLREGKAGALQASQAASPIVESAVESARPLVRRMSSTMRSVDLAQPVKRVQPAATLRRMLGGAAVGVAIVYFMDPMKGAARRQKALDAGRRAIGQLVTAIEPVPGRVSDRLTESFESFRSKAS